MEEPQSPPGSPEPAGRPLSPARGEALEPGPRPKLPGLFPDLLRHVSLALGCGPPESPLFRSFFAEECRAIARQLQPPGPELAAEPLPWDAPGSPPPSPGPPREDAGPGRWAGLALNALNLTVELQGSGASLRQLTFEISAAAALGSTVTLSAGRADESAVSLGSGSFATSTPLPGPARFHFAAGSPLGERLAQKAPQRPAAASQCGSPPAEPRGPGPCARTPGPAAGRSLLLAASGPRRAAQLSGTVAGQGKASRLPRGSSRPSLQRAAAPGDPQRRSHAETQPAASLPATGTAKPSATKPPCVGKCPSALRPPAKLPGLNSSCLSLPGLRVSPGSGMLSMSKGAGVPGIKPPAHPGTGLRLLKPRPSSLQPVSALSTGQPGARSSPLAKETESGVTPSCHKLPVRRTSAAAMPAMAPHSRLRPPGRAAASSRRLPSPKRARLGKGGAAQPPTTGSAPAPGTSCHACALGSGDAAPSTQLPDALLSRELQSVQSELQRVKSELAARDAQCEAYRRTISSQQQRICSLEAQLRAGSRSEGGGATQPGAEGESWPGVEDPACLQ
ncbi:uncharacterized protein LOC142825630 isoform X2 [Pelodiscus sinensis]|uniref:uncharacterized protein LOC142825630 isoform X2 n=1 Tax=Pelodiscus sinensis TaxID=13735 RepID=UPI003F6B76F7